MNQHRIYWALVLIIFALGALPFQSVLANTTTSIVVAPYFVVTESGSTSGQISSLNEMDQSGCADDDPNKYFRHNSESVKYYGYNKIKLPNEVGIGNIKSVLLQVNFKGTGTTPQVWSFSIYNWNSNLWIEVGNTIGTKDNCWNILVFQISSAFRYIAPSGEIKIRLNSSDSSGNAKIDYEAIHITYQPASSTPTSQAFKNQTQKPGYVFPNTYTPTPTSTYVPRPSTIGPHFPLAYGPFRIGQVPSQTPPSSAEISQDLLIIKNETVLIRTYGSCDIWGTISSIANQNNIHVYQGVAISNILLANEKELTCFQDILKTNHNIVGAVVGNEVLLRGERTEDQLVSYIKRVKQIANMDVTTGETWGKWCNLRSVKPRCPGLMNLPAEVDFILAHVYPYWEGVPLEHGAAHVAAVQIYLSTIFPNKPVLIGETGWPTCGENKDNAIPSVGNQKQYIEDLFRMSSKYKFQVLYFEAFDEEWKVVGEGGVARCWGIYNSNRQTKHPTINWETPTPQITPTGPSIRILHPQGQTTTITKNNCEIPILGEAYNANPNWKVKIEVYTDKWYLQDEWYANGLISIKDGKWAVPSITLAGQGQFNNHKIKAYLLDETGVIMASDEISQVVRSNSCQP